MTRLGPIACVSVGCLLLSCSQSNTPSEITETSTEIVDLIAYGDLADYALDDPDLGPIDIRDHQYFGYGWYLPQGAKRWLGARAGSIDLSLTRVRPLRIRLKLAAPQGPAVPVQQLRLFWNGTALGTAELSQAVQTVELEVPVNAQRIGPNRLEIQPKFWVDELRLRLEGKPRDLSVQLQGLEFLQEEPPLHATPATAAIFENDRIVQGPGSVLTYAFPAMRDARLIGKGRFEGAGNPLLHSSEATVEVYLSDRQGRTRSVWRQTARASDEDQGFDFSLDLSDFSDDYFAISIVHETNDSEASPKVIWERLEVTTRPTRAPPKPAQSEPPHRPNILVVLFDTLRADHTEAYGATNVRTPNILRLSQEGATFQNAYAPSSWTRSSVATLLTAANISYHKTDGEADVFPPDIPYLPEILNRIGYATTGISFNGHITQQWGFARGFDTFHELGMKRPTMLEQLTTPEDYAAYIWQDFLGPATATEAPFFVYLHELDPHAPYEPAPPYDTMYPDAYRGWADIAGRDIHLVRFHLTNLEQADYEHLNAQYRGEISFMDAYLGVMLDKLEASGRLEDTLIVFLSDHGEEFGEHGGIGHGVTLHNEVLKVPFIWYWKGIIRRDATIPDAVGLIDFTPTILDFLSLPIPDAMQGRSLKPLLTGKATGERTRSLYSSLGGTERRFRRGIQRDDWKLIRLTVSGHDSYALYDLSSDPKEFNNLWAREPVIGGALQQELDRALRSDAESSTVTSATIPEELLDPEEVERLKNLGYLQ